MGQDRPILPTRYGNAPDIQNKATMKFKEKRYRIFSRRTKVKPTWEVGITIGNDIETKMRN